MRALADGDRRSRQLGEERREAVLVDHALRQRRVAAPREARRSHDLAIDRGVGDAALFVAVLVQHALLVVGDGLVTPHLLDVDVVAQAVDRALLFLGLGDADVHVGSPLLLSRKRWRHCTQRRGGAKAYRSLDSSIVLERQVVQARVIAWSKPPQLWRTE